MMAILKVQRLCKDYPARKSIKPSREPVRALDNVNLSVSANETLAIVGESGSGKSTLAKCILRIERPTSGRIHYRGENVLALSKAALLRFRRSVQFIFSDADTALNPVLPIGDAIAEPLIAHGLCSKSQARHRAKELLQQVGLDCDFATRLPRELSCGQRHRVVMARALSLQPQMLIMDEPLASLDLLTKARLFDLLLTLKQKFKLTMILISHDFSFVQSFCDRVAVMRNGRIIEENEVGKLFESPAHAYTRQLLCASNEPTVI